MDCLTKKFQDVFDSMKSNQAITVELDLYEVSGVLAALKCTDSYSKALEDNLNATFIKVENEFLDEK